MAKAPKNKPPMIELTGVAWKPSDRVLEVLRRSKMQLEEAKGKFPVEKASKKPSEKYERLELEILCDCFKAVTDYLRHSLNPLGDNEEVFWFLNLFNEHFAAKKKTMLQNKNIGCFVQALVLLRCPRNNAIAAVSKWVDSSTDKVKKANSYFVNTYKDKNRLKDISAFLTLRHVNIIDGLIKSQGKPFPSEYKKAALAFSKLQEILKKWQKRLYQQGYATDNDGLDLEIISG